MASSSVNNQRNLAVLLGVTTAAVIGVGVYYYYYNRKNKTKRFPTSTTLKAQKVENSLKSPDEEVPIKQLSPLEKAVELKNRGNECFKAGRFGEAIKFYTEAIEACPTDVSPVELSAFYQNRAAAQEKLNNFYDVIDDCTKALEGNKQYIKAIVRRAKAYERLEKYKEALTDFTAACVLEGFANFSTLASIDTTLKALSLQRAKQTIAERAGRPMPLSRTFVDAYLQSFAEDPVLNDIVVESKLADGGGAAETDSDYALSGYAKAKHLLQTKQYDDIIPICNEIIKNGSDHQLEATLLRGTFYLLMGLPAAMEDFDNVLEQLKDGPAEDAYVKKVKSNIYVKRGSLFMQYGQKDEAMENFKMAETADPNNVDVYHHRGQLLLLLNDLDGARADLEKATQLRPDFALCLAQRCFVDYRFAMSTQNPSLMHQAMSEFQNIIDKFPECSEAYALYAQALAEHEDFDEAARLFEKANKLTPMNANIYVHKALLIGQASEGGINKSVELIEQALQVDPYCEFAYEALGTTELQRGNLERAMELFEKAISVARTEVEMLHLFSLYETTAAQIKASKELNVPLSKIAPGLGAYD